MHLSQEGQRQAMRARLAAELAPLGIEAPPIQPSPRALGYRSRSNFVAHRKPGGRVVLGSYAPRSHEVADMSGCRVLAEPGPAVADALAERLTEASVPIAEEPGGLRYVGLRVGPEGEVLLELIVRDGDAPWIAPLAEGMLEVEGVVGVTASVNDSTGNAIRVSPAAPVAGRSAVRERIAGFELEVSCGSFTQLNAEVASAMADRLAERVEPADVVADLYCGVGLLGLRVLREHPGARLFGAESTPSAVAQARALAEASGVEATFEAVDLRQGAPEGWPAPGLVVLNPPRRGADRAVIAYVASAGPRQVAYMSCNPATFARDALALNDAGYALGAVEAWDMLPQTGHVELLATLTRQS